MSTTPEPQHITVQEVAALLNISDKTVVRRIRDGSLRGFKLGGIYRVNRADVDLLLRGGK